MLKAREQTLRNFNKRKFIGSNSAHGDYRTLQSWGGKGWEQGAIRKISLNNNGLETNSLTEK